MEELNTDRQTDRQTDRHTDRQTGRETETDRPKSPCLVIFQKKRAGYATLVFLLNIYFMYI